jgi:hypothetical protein
VPMLARLLSLAALALVPASAWAQPPSSFPDTAGVIPPEWINAPVRTGQGDSRSPWHMDLLFGLPLGVRAQRDIGDTPWVCEGFLGLVLINPSVGAGLRRRCVLYQGETRSFMVNPGVDAYLSAIADFSGIGNAMGGGGGGGGTGGFFSADVDLIWSHAGACGSDSRLGVKLGGAVGTGGALPIASFFLGWSF